MTTANTNLKQHIKKFHRDLWLANAQKNRWKNLDSQVSTQSVASQGRPREEFDVDKFHQYILKFIVVDDQVSQICAPIVSVSHCFIAPSINVIKCLEFWNLLLLLQSNLQDVMIPHRTKVCQLILEAWSNSFKLLKVDLKVSLSPPKPLLLVNITCPELFRSNILHAQ
jgi:hypothetical protein